MMGYLGVSGIPSSAQNNVVSCIACCCFLQICEMKCDGNEK